MLFKFLFDRQKKSNSANRNRRLHMELLENRELLSVSTTEFAALRSTYADLNLSAKLSDYNVIEITASQLSENNLRNALLSASLSDENDLIVVRTTAARNAVKLSGEALTIVVDVETKGGVTIVSLGPKSLTIDGDGKSCVFSIYGANTTVAIGGLTVTGGIGDEAFRLVSNPQYGDSLQYECVGGGIANAGRLTMDRCDVVGNMLVDRYLRENGYVYHGKNLDRTGLYGSGISNSGFLSMTRCRVAENGYDDAVGVTDLFGYGIHASAESTLVMKHCEVAANYDGGLFAEGASITIEQSSVTDNLGRWGEGYGGNGIWMIDSSGSISETKILRNVCRDVFAGLRIDSEYVNVQVTVADCVISGNTTTGDYAEEYGAEGHGIFVMGNKGLQETHVRLDVTDCIVSDNAGNGIDAYHTILHVKNSTVDGNRMGGVYVEKGELTAENSTVSDNISRWDGVLDLQDVGGHGILLRNSSGDLSGMRIERNQCFGLGGGLIFYDDVGGHELTVSGGVISGNTGGGVAIYKLAAGGDIAVIDTLVSSNLIGGILLLGNETGGNFLLDGCSILDNTLFGVNYMSDDMAFAMKNCTVSRNGAAVEVDGKMGEGMGGVVLSGARTSSVVGVTIENCMISDNSSDKNGGGLSLTVCAGTVSDSIVSGNRAGGSGGGIFSFESDIDVFRSSFGGNESGSHGGAVYLDGFSNMRFYHSVVSGNKAGGDGGGIYLNEPGANKLLTPFAYFSSSTVVGNVAARRGGGVWNENGELRLRNTIVAHNRSTVDPPDVAIGDAKQAVAYAHHSFIGTRPGPAGFAEAENVFYGDPGLAGYRDATWDKNLWKSWDLRLKAGSWCIDAGNDDFLPDDESATDIGGNARIEGKAVDIGAYEYGAKAAFAPPPVVSTSSTDEGTVILTWREIVPGATHYGVWRLGDDGKWEALDTNVKGTTFTDKAPIAGAQQYAVRAYKGTKHGDFVPVGVTVFFGAPKAVATSPSAGQAALRWQEVVDATHYGVWRLGTNGKWIELCRNVTETSFLDEAAPPGTQTYAVRAFRGKTYSGFQPVDVAVELGIPRAAALVQSKTSIQLAWNDVAGATHYGVWRMDGAGKWVALDTNVKGTTFTDKAAPAGPQTYAVRAHVGKTYGGFLPADSVEIPKVTGSTRSDGCALLRWEAVVGATHYGVWRLDTNGKWAILDKNVTETSFVDDASLPGGQTYAVRAYVGTSYTGFEPVAVEVAFAAPDVVVANNAHASVTLTWNRVAGAVRYGVWYRGADGKWVALDVNVTGTSFIDTTAQLGRRTYAVRAWQGKAYSDFEPVVVDTVIGVPRATAVAQSKTSIALSWERVAGATHYGVWRLGADGKWTELSRNVKETSFTDKKAASDVETYAVRAFVGDRYGSFIPVSAVGIPNVTATTPSPTSVKLTWNAVPGATHYGVWRMNDQGKWETLDVRVTDTTWTDRTAAGAETYAVRAYVETVYGGFIAVSSRPFVLNSPDLSAEAERFGLAMAELTDL